MPFGAGTEGGHPCSTRFRLGGALCRGLSTPGMSLLLPRDFGVAVRPAGPSPAPSLHWVLSCPRESLWGRAMPVDSSLRDIRRCFPGLGSVGLGAEEGACANHAQRSPASLIASVAEPAEGLVGSCLAEGCPWEEGRGFRAFDPPSAPHPAGWARPRQGIHRLVPGPGGTKWLVWDTKISVLHKLPEIKPFLYSCCPTHR